MSTKKIKESLGRNYGEGRGFGKAVKHLSFFAPERPRTWIMIGLFFSAVVMYPMFYRMGMDIKKSFYYEREKSKFRKQLDQEYGDGGEE